MSKVQKQLSPLIVVVSILAVFLATLATSLVSTRAARPATVPASATTVAAAESLKTFVFQVGIDKYTSSMVPTLDGCVKDVTDMKALMIKKFNVPASNFLTLTNGQATHAAIITGFKKQLIENAKAHRDATVVFQFSGHGSRVKDRSGTKADGFSSTLVPVDSRDIKGSYFDIVDDEIRELFEELSQYTSNITFILDACHSRNPTRGAGKTRSIPADTRPQPAPKTQPPPKPKPAGTRGELPLRGGELAAMLPREQRYVAIAATLPSELAHETKSATNGAMTFQLLKALARSTPDTSYRQLMADVANNVTTEFVDQHPQVEGDIGRPVFGGSASREDPFIEIQDVTKGLMTIKAGLAHGIASGTIVAVYAPNAQRLAGNENRLGTGTVIAVAPFTSNVALKTTNVITTQAKVVVVSPDFGSIRTRVAFAKEGATRGSSSAIDTQAEVTRLLKGSRSVDIAGEVDGSTVRGANWDVLVRQVKFSDWFYGTAEAGSTTGVSTRNIDRQVYCIVGPDGSRPLFGFFRELDNPNASGDIADALEHLANQRSLRAINNEASQLNGAIKINVLRVYGKPGANSSLTIEREEMVELPKGAMDYPFDLGEFFRFEIENQSNEDLYVTFFDISTDGSIAIPYASAPVVIAKGGKVRPKELIFRTTVPAGFETFKIIASTNPTGRSDFAFLQQGAVRTRSTPFSIESLPDWTTAQVNFVISDKVK